MRSRGVHAECNFAHQIRRPLRVALPSGIMEDHYVASERSQRVEWKATGGGKYPERQWYDQPLGECHAVKPGDVQTACGISVGALVPMADHPWGRGTDMHWCDDCEAVVPL